MSNRALVIGAGLGGIAAAIRLAKQGWEVTVLERGSATGGKLNRLERAGHVFDTGPSLITLPQVFARLFELAGGDFYSNLQPHRVDPLFEYRFGPDRRLTYSSQLPELQAEFQRFTGNRDDVDGLYRFLELGSRLFDLSEKTFFSRPPLSRPRLSELGLLLSAPKRHAWGSYKSAVRSHFSSPDIRKIFERYPTYVGSSPDRAVGTLALIPYMELAFGGWYVPGGLYRIVESLYDLAVQAGIEFQFNAVVQSIETSDRRIASVVDDQGRRFSADIVVSNPDPAIVHDLSGGQIGRRLDPENRSMSGFVMLIGMRGKAEGLRHHTVCFSDDYDREFEQIFGERRFPDDPTVYVNIPSRTDSSVAPDGDESIFVMANAPAEPDAWTPEYEAEAMRRVARRLEQSGMPDLLGNAKFVECWTPARLQEAYSAPGGSIYGQVSHGWKGTFLRPSLSDRRARNLFYVGGGTHPGGGTPTVLMSAEIVSQMIGEPER